ncbi:MAG: tetratricopeptide repeat protein [Treponema sp.]|nr:tetratricopeptide repeat protein [Treponema sp.]
MKNSASISRLVFSLFISFTLFLTSCINQGDMYIQQGSNYLQKGQYDPAEEAFMKALDEECAYGKDYIYILISTCRVQKGDYDGAIEWRKKALDVRIDPDNYINLGMLYRLKEDDATAEEMYKKAIEIAPQDANTYGSLGAMYLSQDRIDEAIPYFQECLRMNPYIGIIHADLAICYGRKGLFDQAEEEMSAALSLRAENHDDLRDELDEMEKKAGYVKKE